MSDARSSSKPATATPRSRKWNDSGRPVERGESVASAARLSGRSGLRDASGCGRRALNGSAPRGRVGAYSDTESPSSGETIPPEPNVRPSWEVSAGRTGG